MDENRYDAGYRDAITHTIVHLSNRIMDEKKWAEEWHNFGEYKSYIRALDDIRKYLEWLIDTNK